MILIDKSPLFLRVLVMMMLSLSMLGAVKAKGEYLSSDPAIDADLQITLPANDSVLFEVHAINPHSLCSGSFTNAVGGVHKSFSSAIRVKFAPSAEGKANPCTITLTTKGKHAGESPIKKTVTVQVIIPKLISRTFVHVQAAPDSRTTLGVGEQVMLTVEPKEALLDPDVTWSADDESYSSSQHTGVAAVLTAGMPVTRKKPRTNGVSERSNPLGTAKKSTKGRVVISFEDGLPKLLDRYGVQGNNNPVAFISVPDTSAARANDYSKELETLDQALRKHKLTYENALVALASMKSGSLNTVPGGGWNQPQPHALAIKETDLVARTLFTFREPLDPTYDPEKRPSYRVEPPREATLLPEVFDPSNITPEQIQEPALRKKYQEAIAANEAKIKSYEAQREAHFAYDLVRRYTINYLQSLRKRSHIKTRELSVDLRQAGLDQSTTSQILKQMDGPAPRMSTSE